LGKFVALANEELEDLDPANMSPQMTATDREEFDSRRRQVEQLIRVALHNIECLGRSANDPESARRSAAIHTDNTATQGESAVAQPGDSNAPNMVTENQTAELTSARTLLQGAGVPSQNVDEVLRELRFVGMVTRQKSPASYSSVLMLARLYATVQKGNRLTLDQVQYLENKDST
jgi:hypothetical protein